MCYSNNKFVLKQNKKFNNFYNKYGVIILTIITCIIILIYLYDEFAVKILVISGILILITENIFSHRQLVPWITFIGSGIFILFIAGAFGSIIYPLLPPVLNGIDNSQKSLIYKNEYFPMLNQLGIIDSCKIQSTIPVQVLYENDRTYYLGTNDTLRWTLDKDVFLGKIEN